MTREESTRVIAKGLEKRDTMFFDLFFLHHRTCAIDENIASDEANHICALD